MKKIPEHLRKEIETDPFYRQCSRWRDGGCDGRITIEHTIIFASRQLNEKFALIPLCEYHHAVNLYLDGKGLDKRKNVWIALNRATDEEIKRISVGINYFLIRENLNKKYGQYNRS